MLNNFQTDQTLSKIKQLLKPQSKKFQDQSLQQADPQFLLKSAGKIIRERKQKQFNNELTARLKQANALLKSKEDHVKSYVRDKIVSSVFQTPTKKMSQVQQREIENQKQAILQRRRQQIIQQQKRKQSAIQNTRRFRKGEKVSNIPIAYINSRMRNQPLINQLSQGQVSSENNFIQEGVPLSEVAIPKGVEKYAPETKKDSKAEIQIQLQEENQQGFVDAVQKQFISSIQKSLKKHPKFVAVFKQFLEKQIRLSSKSFVDLIGAIWLANRSSVSINPSEPERSIYKYKVRPVKSNNLMKQRSLTNLVKKYKNTKPIGIKPIASGDNQIICEKLISKRIGQSYKFHTKKSILFANEIYYADEKSSELKKQEIPMQVISTTPMKKQQGSIINKKDKMIDLVTLRGIKRNFYFIKDQVQGNELFLQLKQLMAMKIYMKCGLINQHQNYQFQDFIKNPQKKCLNLSKVFISGTQRNNFREVYEQFLPIISSLLEERQKIQIINLCDSKLQSNSLTALLSTFSKASCLKSLSLDRNLLSKESLQTIYRILKSSNQPYVDLSMKSCQLNDELFISTSLSLKDVIQKISILNLSQNKLTGKSIDALSSCICSKPNTVLKKADLGNNPLKDATCIDNLLSAAVKMETLIICSCGLSLDQQQIKIIFRRRKCKLIDLDLRGNQELYELNLIQDYWNDPHPKNVLVNVGRFSEKVSLSLRGQFIG